jgi:hypothetical protein
MRAGRFVRHEPAAGIDLKQYAAEYRELVA